MARLSPDLEAQGLAEFIREQCRYVQWFSHSESVCRPLLDPGGHARKVVPEISDARCFHRETNMSHRSKVVNPVRARHVPACSSRLLRIPKCATISESYPSLKMKVSGCRRRGFTLI